MGRCFPQSKNRYTFETLW
ncbi:hypothetical protein AAY473_009553 [Plecturocebus cupreus]